MMQTTLQTILEQKYLAAALVSCGIVVLFANALGREAAVVAGNFMYVPTTGILLILATVAVFKFGTSGHHGIAWFAFAGYAASAFTAEMLWIGQEVYLQIDPFPSAADVFYLIGYPFLLMFFIAYLQPVKAGITKKMLAATSVFSLSVLALGLYVTVGNGTDDVFATVVAAIYPVFDSILIVPALIGVALFFKGKVNFMWTLFCLGTICVFVADAAFLLGQNEDSYYTGNPAEILFYWNYILLAFGVKNHTSLFQSRKKRDGLGALHA